MKNKLKTFMVTNKYFQTLVRAETMDLALAKLADNQKGKDFKAVEVMASTNLLSLMNNVDFCRVS